MKNVTLILFIFLGVAIPGRALSCKWVLERLAHLNPRAWVQWDGPRYPKSDSAKLANHLDVSTCQLGRCFQNAGVVLDQLRKLPKFDVNDARVLFISSLDSWGVHVVVEYEGNIMDIEYPMGATDKSNRVISTPVAQYFKNHKWNSEKSRVLEAPAVSWTENVSKEEMIRHDRLVSGWDDFDPSRYPGYRYLHVREYLSNPRRK